MTVQSGLCGYGWRVRADNDEDTYRQHRCGRERDHAGACVCRYCGARGRDHSTADGPSPARDDPPTPTTSTSTRKEDL